LYDGTIKITGCKKLIWKKLPINDQDIQVLPASERGFPCLPTDFDIVSTAEKHFETCRREQRQDVDFFIQHGREAFQKYSEEVCLRSAFDDGSMATVYLIFLCGWLSAGCWSRASLCDPSLR
jgi:hypothetical protein